MIRILFVDDEPRVLDGLRRLLRTHRDRWDMVFALGGAAAIAELERATFDVIVTDMRMPEMDGLALLTAARERWPRAARIVLSGYMDTEVVLRSTSVAHQFLAKPCDPAELEAVVERTCRLAAVLTDERLRGVVGEVGALATRPSVYAALERVVADPRAGLADVAAIIEGEVSLTAKVLQVVNSSFFGLPQRATSVAHAVSYLGANVIRALVLSHEIGDTLGGRPLPAGFSLATHQMHALRVARLARTIAGGGAVADDAFLAGVLHDVGELLLATRRPEWLHDAAAHASSREVPLHEAEADLFGTTHAEVGAYLVGLWGLPFRIVEAVACHHTPTRVGSRGAVDAVAAVHIADALVAEVAPGGVSGAPSPALDLDYARAVGVAERLEGWREKAALE